MFFAAVESNSLAAPVVFWGSDHVKPGNVVLLYGGGLAVCKQVRLSAIPDGRPVDVPTIQAGDGSLKFVLPQDQPGGLYAVNYGGEKPWVLNRPETWFMQPTALKPGLVVNQATPGSEVQVIGKNFSVSGDESARPKIGIRQGKGGKIVELAVVKAEPFSIIAKIPETAATGPCEILVHNGRGGNEGWSAAFSIEIRKPEVWPDKVFNVRDFGAKGDDVTDDTKAIRDTLDAADKNGGGVVFLPWGTYRLSDWICIPPHTRIHGESRNNTLLKWPVDTPQTAQDFQTAAIYGAPPYAMEDLMIVTRKADTALMDLSWEYIAPKSVPPELLPKLKPWGGFRDVFLRRLFFQNWIQCEHPERQPDLAKKYWEGAYNVRIGGVENLEVSDCMLWGANNYLSNNRNVRFTGNRVANGMGGHSWTCLGGGAIDMVCENNDLNCSSSWGWGWTGMQRVYSAHNNSHNFVRGEREAMTLDISSLPTARPVSQYWGSPVEVGNTPEKPFLRFPPPGTKNADGFTTGFTPGCFKEGTVTVRAYEGGEGANQTRQIVDNTADTIYLDKPFQKVPEIMPRKGYIEVAPRHWRAHNGTTAWLGRMLESKPAEFTADGAHWIPQEFVGMTALVLDGKGAGQYRVVKSNTDNRAVLEQPWDVTPDSTSTIGVWSLMRQMVVYDCEASDTSAFAQLYGAFYDYTVDHCQVERTQGIWGQMGWFVQFRDNTVSYANSYHNGIGMRGPNPEKCAPFGYTGLDSGRLRITKSQAFQYPDKKLPVFSDDVLPAPVPSTLGHIQRGNTLRYNQRLVVQPWTSEKPPGPRLPSRFRDVIIDDNRIEHGAVGIQIGPDVTGVVLGLNHFEDVAQPVIEANPAAVEHLGGRK